MIDNKQVKTNHIQDGQWEIYCHKIKNIFSHLSQVHIDTQCLAGCPYFFGGYQGNGIECLYYDGTNAPVDLLTDAWTLKERMKVLEEDNIVKG